MTYNLHSSGEATINGQEVGRPDAEKMAAKAVVSVVVDVLDVSYSKRLSIEI